MDASAGPDCARADVENATRRIAVLAGHNDEPPPSVEYVRQAVREAKYHLQAARAALAEIEPRGRGIEQTIRSMQADVAARLAPCCGRKGRTRFTASLPRHALHSGLRRESRDRTVHARKHRGRIRKTTPMPKRCAAWCGSWRRLR